MKSQEKVTIFSRFNMRKEDKQEQDKKRKDWKLQEKMSEIRYTGRL